MVSGNRTLAIYTVHHLVACETVEADEDIIPGPLYQKQPFLEILLRVLVAYNVEMDRPGRVQHDRLSRRRFSTRHNAHAAKERTFISTAPSLAESSENMMNENVGGSGATVSVAFFSGVGIVLCGRGGDLWALLRDDAVVIAAGDASREWMEDGRAHCTVVEP